ncbi:putative WD repeat-containing protein C17D11.16 [Senna tora]|uniref:Putative WD repeat-containing protein C17D11.16 n=1 Tax=Senna tora TaxID=362788 RepID=A0A834U0J4_9FABA|nr:putative WD repeat-containing protein C17D11.16 [Senna tora]
MISAISWIPKGASKAEPIVADPPSKEEIEEFIQSSALDRRYLPLFLFILFENEENDEGMDVETNKQGDEVAQALNVAEALGKASTEKCDEITLGLKELDMEHYDDEDEGVELFSSGNGDLYYPSNELDPYLNDKEDDDSEELEDMIINPTDSVVICARNEDDVSLLEVWILEDPNSAEVNMFVHHDIIIPAFPLCTAWLDCPLKGGERGNFIAVGSMEPSIEIWNLDVIDEVQPCVVLGGFSEKKKKGKKKSAKYKKDSHTDSVLGLAWNKEYRNILASASADTRVKIWDVVAEKCDITMEHHSDKVQAVAWNHHAPQVLLSGSFDHTVVMKDGRMPSHSGYKWSVSADVESLAWDPHTEHSFVVSLEDGVVKGFDIRAAKSDSTSEPSSTFTLHAHDKAVTSISYNLSAANLLATGSMDKTVKLWDLSNNQPSCVATKIPKAGAVFSISFSEDNPFFLAIGGSEGKLEVWDTLSDAGVSRRFTKNRPQSES